MISPGSRIRMSEQLCVKGSLGFSQNEPHTLTESCWVTWGLICWSFWEFTYVKLFWCVLHTSGQKWEKKILCHCYHFFTLSGYRECCHSLCYNLSLSAIALLSLTGEVKNTLHLVTVQCTAGKTCILMLFGHLPPPYTYFHTNHTLPTSLPPQLFTHTYWSREMFQRCSRAVTCEITYVRNICSDFLWSLFTQPPDEISKTSADDTVCKRVSKYFKRLWPQCVRFCPFC